MKALLATHGPTVLKWLFFVVAGGFIAYGIYLLIVKLIPSWVSVPPAPSASEDRSEPWTEEEASSMILSLMATTGLLNDDEDMMKELVSNLSGPQLRYMDAIFMKDPSRFTTTDIKSLQAYLLEYYPEESEFITMSFNKPA